MCFPGVFIRIILGLRRDGMKKRHNWKRNALWCLFLVVFLSFFLFSQEGRGRGRIHGTVQDTQGNPLEGVKIIAQHIESGTKFEATSEKDGTWAVAGLGTGFFRITASKKGYGTVYHEMRVSQFSRKNPPVEFTMKKAQSSSMNMPAIKNEESIELFEEGNQYFQQEKYKEAVEKYKEFLEKNPTIYQVYINIGNSYKKMGEYEKAVENFNKVLDEVKGKKGSYEGDESAARALTSLGETYMKQGELEKANESLTQAIELVPDDETLAFNVGEIYFDQRKTDKAIEYFKKSTKVNENWPPPHLKLGYAYLNKGEYQKAVESFNKFLELAPEDDPHAATVKNLIPQIKKMIKDD